jgi:hypothetical protein
VQNFAASKDERERLAWQGLYHEAQTLSSNLIQVRKTIFVHLEPVVKTFRRAQERRRKKEAFGLLARRCRSTG